MKIQGNTSLGLGCHVLLALARHPLLIYNKRQNCSPAWKKTHTSDTVKKPLSICSKKTNTLLKKLNRYILPSKENLIRLLKNIHTYLYLSLLMGCWYKHRNQTFNNYLLGVFPSSNKTSDGGGVLKYLSSVPSHISVTVITFL